MMPRVQWGKKPDLGTNDLISKHHGWLVSAMTGSESEIVSEKTYAILVNRDSRTWRASDLAV
jgi:hypothetical protein